MDKKLKNLTNRYLRSDLTPVQFYHEVYILTDLNYVEFTLFLKEQDSKLYEKIQDKQRAEIFMNM